MPSEKNDDPFASASCAPMKKRDIVLDNHNQNMHGAVTVIIVSGR